MKRIPSFVGLLGLLGILGMVVPQVFGVSVDGDFSDWSDAEYFYLTVECASPMSGQSCSPPNVLLDTDLNKKTGFLSGPLGAEFFVAPPRDAAGLFVTDGRFAGHAQHVLPRGGCTQARASGMFPASQRRRDQGGAAHLHAGLHTRGFCLVHSVSQQSPDKDAGG